MKIIVTGSLGNIGRPLATELLKRGHTVTVITSKEEKAAEIGSLGAHAAVGSMEDVDFLTRVFRGADVVYCMCPPNYWFDGGEPLEHYKKNAEAHAAAIRASGVRRVIYLSSFGAHLDHGTGFILGSYYAEQILGELADVAITFIRPTSFYYNLFGFIDVIKAAGMIVANYGGDDELTFVSPSDIAAAIVDEIEGEAAPRKVRYVSSDELTGNEVAHILGAAIGKPDLQWVVVSDAEALAGLEAHGMTHRLAELLVELNASVRSGALASDYVRHRPALGKVKMKDFAADFAAAYNRK